jgi:hypothetical protein
MRKMVNIISVLLSHIYQSGYSTIKIICKKKVSLESGGVSNATLTGNILN